VSQTVLFLAIHLLGLAVCLAVGPRRAPAMCCALAFPIGLAVTVLLALVILLVGVPYGPWSMGPAMVAVATAAAIASARRGLVRRDLVIAGVWTGIFAIAFLPLTHFNVALFTNNDSHSIVHQGVIIANDGSLLSDSLAKLGKIGVFQIVSQSMLALSLRDFLYSLPLALGLTFIPMFALALWHALRAAGTPTRRRSMPAMLVAVVTAALFTMSMVDFHILYVHTNLGSAVYLFGFVALFWIAEVRGDPSWLPLAFVSLTAFALQRTETPLVAALFLAMTLSQTALPRRAVTFWLGGFTLVVAAWFEILAHHVPSTAFLTASRNRLMYGLLVVLFLWWLASDTRLVRRVNRWLPALIAGVCALAVAAAFAAQPDRMSRSTLNWVTNLTENPLWGNSWIFIPALLLLGLALEPPRFRQVFTIGIPVYVGFLLLLSFNLRVPYRIGLADSANRMTIHFVPLIFFYLAIKFIPALLRTGPSGSDGRRGAGDAGGANDGREDMEPAGRATGDHVRADLVGDQIGT